MLNWDIKDLSSHSEYPLISSYLECIELPMSEPQISELLDGGISSHAALQGLLEGSHEM